MESVFVRQSKGMCLSSCASCSTGMDRFLNKIKRFTIARLFQKIQVKLYFGVSRGGKGLAEEIGKLSAGNGK
jgi:hypothetical protein